VRIVIRYELRLGDIVNCLPIADALHQRGCEVLFLCRPEYHEIFRCVDYVKPVAFPVMGVTHLDLQVWPERYTDFRASKKSWQQYVYEIVAQEMGIGLDIHSAPRFTNTEVDFDGYGLTEGEYDLVSPYGISQQWRPTYDNLLNAADLAGFDAVYAKYLVPPSMLLTPNAVTARTIADLPGLIRGARKFLCINSAPNIIAAGVRKEWSCFYQPDFGGQDLRVFAGQNIIHANRSTD
jgi:hypothetical protein